MQIKTARLMLFDLSLQQLEWMLNAPQVLEAQLGFAVSRSNLQGPVQRALRMKIERMRGEDPSHHPWSTYWLIVTENPRFGAGMAGFKGAPDASGAVEIGYGIDAQCQGKGYMTEAARALIEWAFSQPGCQTVTAIGVLKTNLASQHVLVNVGMAQYAEDDLTTSWKIEHPWDGQPA